MRFKILLCLFLCLIATQLFDAGQLFTADWVSYGGDSAGTRRSAETITLPIAQKWFVSVGSPIYSTPAVADGMIYVCTQDGYVKAYKESDQSAAWSRKYAGFYSSPAVVLGRLYVSTIDGYIICLDSVTGIELWTYYTGSTEMSSPVVEGGIVYTGSGFPNNKVMALSAYSGELQWETVLEQTVYSSPVIANGVLYIGCNSGMFYALDIEDSGAVLYSFLSDGTPGLSSPLVYNDQIYVVPGTFNLKVYALDTTMTAQLEQPLSNPDIVPAWTQSVPCSPALSSGNLYVIAGYPNMAVFAFDAVTLSPAWAGATAIGDASNTVYASAPAVTDQYVFAGSQADRKLYVLNISDGVIADSENLDGDVYAAPVIANGRIYVVTTTGTLYAFEGQNGPPSAPASGFNPADSQLALSGQPVFSWGAGVDPDNDTLSYSARYDTDGEVLGSYYEYPLTALLSVQLPQAYPDNTHIYYAVRAKDTSGAYSEWSAIQDFWIVEAPLPPSDFTAVPGSTSVELSWTASASTDMDTYLLTYRATGGVYGPYTEITDAISITIDNLTGGVTYEFYLVAEDYDGLQSAGVEASTTPSNMAVSILGAVYNNIAEAAASAQSGETIQLSEGIYYFQDTVSLKAGVSVTGAANGNTILNGSLLSSSPMFQIISGSGAPGTISGITFKDGDTGIDTNQFDVTVKNCIFVDQSTAILVRTDSAADIINNTISRCTYAVMVEANATANIKNNIFIRNYGYGVFAMSSAVVNSSYNDVYGNLVSDYSNTTPATTDISQDVVFMDESGDDFRETAGQPVIDAGDPLDEYANETEPNGSRINMGAFGNTALAAVSPVVVEDPTPPPDEPPADQPPADQPPADQPPADQPPADQPPVDDDGIVYNPPVDDGLTDVPLEETKKKDSGGRCMITNMRGSSFLPAMLLLLMAVLICFIAGAAKDRRMKEE